MSLVRDLISGAPEHDGRMVAVTAYKVNDVALMPFVKVKRIAERTYLTFAHAPFVESFVHNKKAHAIAHIEKLWSRWIVRGANGIRAHFFEDFQAALPNALGDGSTDRTRLMMDASTVELYMAPVQ